MLENISVTNVQPSPGFIPGSSSTDGEDINFLHFIDYPVRVLLRHSLALPIDTASFAVAVSLDFTSESVRYQETVEDKISNLKLLFGSWIESGNEDEQINAIFESRQISSGPLDE